MKAAVHIREEPSYRSDAFRAGLVKVGYKLAPYFQRGVPSDPDDLLVLWNIHRDTEGPAAEWEAQGGTVLVCENGYIGKDEIGRQLYAISTHGHNGAGWFPVGDGSRFAALGLQLEPWTTDEAGHILVCGQRGVGSREMASPPNWHTNAAARLRYSGREVRVRLHPGNKAPPPGTPTLTDALRGASACAIWSSSSGIKALLAGVPVLYDAPYWICSGAACRLDQHPVRDDAARLEALQRMAWGQWRVAEIEAGEPFARMREARWSLR